MLSGKTKGERGILCFVTPYASPAAVLHANKLLDCLAPNADRLYFVGDKRVKISDKLSNVIRLFDLPTLHYVKDIHPRFLSMVLWVLRLFQIILMGCYAVVKTNQDTDVVVCFLGPYFTPILLVARMLHKKSVTFEPGDVVNLTKAVYGQSKMTHIFVKFLTLIRTANRNLANICGIETRHELNQEELRPFEKKFRVVNIYTDTEIYKIQHPFPLRKKVVGFVGRLSASKGIREFLKAAVILKESGIRFYIIGDGPLKDEVLKEINRAQCSHITYLGWIETKELVNYLNEISLLVLPSDSEGLPNVLLEAMACGTPVLATPVGGIPDLIQPEYNGFLLPDRTPEAIAASISEAFCNPKLASISEQASAYIKANYSLDASVKRWNKVLSDLL